MKKAVSCAQCGTKMRAGIKFCSKCGYRLKDAEAEARAEAAQAEEAAANFLTEEEVAALRAAEVAPVAEEVAALAAPAAPAEEAAPSPKLLKLQERTEASKKKYADAQASALYKQRAATEKGMAKRGAKVDSHVARVEAVVDSERQRSEEIARLAAAKREKTLALAGTKAARKNAVAEKKLSSMQVDENKRAAKLAAAADKKNFKDSLAIDRRDAERAEREDRKAIASRAFESQIANLRQNSEHALSKKQDKETLNLEKKSIAGKEEALREKIKGDRSLAKALRAEDKKEAKLLRTEANAAVYEKKAENRMLKERVEKERVQQKHRVSSDEKLQSTRLNSEFKTAKKLSVERMKQTRALLNEEAKAAGRDNRELKKQVEEKAFDNRLQERQEAIDRKIRKRREADKRRVAEKQAAVRQKATKKIGAIEYKSASVSMTAETSEARRQAMIAERDMKCMLKEEKLKKREVEAETRLIDQRIRADERVLNVRTGGEMKTAKKLTKQRLKQTRALLNEEAKIASRQNDELKAVVKEKAFDNRLYSKQLSSQMKIRKRRENDLTRSAAKTAAIEARETKRLGAAEYKTAAIGMSADAMALRRQVSDAKREMKLARADRKLANLNAAARNRIDPNAPDFFANDAVCVPSYDARYGVRYDAHREARYGNANRVGATFRPVRTLNAIVRPAVANPTGDLAVYTAEEPKVATKLDIKRVIKEEKLTARRQSMVAERDMKRMLKEQKLKNREADLESRLNDYSVNSDRRLLDLRAGSELKTAKKVSDQRLKHTRALLNEEEKLANRQNDDLKTLVQEKEFDNRLHAKLNSSKTKIRKRRENDLARAAAKTVAIEARETKRLGAMEYKTAAIGLSPEVLELRRQAQEVECDIRRKQGEERVFVRESNAEKRLARRRVSDLEKVSRLKTAQRAKAEQRLGRAELKSVKTVKTAEALDSLRKVDAIDLDTERRLNENKLYAKKLAAEHRIADREINSAKRNQEIEIKGLKDKSEAKRLGDNRAVRMVQDEARRALNKEKNQDYLYNKKTSLDENIDKREHKLALRAAKVEEENSKRLIAQKEKEQKKNLRLAERYRKDALRRAKKISKISGVPVSQVPALMGEAAPSALLAAGGAQDVGVPSLREPDALLKNSYASNVEQYKEYKQRQKAEKSRLRYVEIGVRNDKKYFSTIYDKGEIMVAKRTVRVARIQAVLAIVLMVVALLACFQPFYTLDLSNYRYFPVAIKDTILDGTGELSFKSLVTDSSGADLVTSIVNGINSYLIAFPQAMEQDTFLAYLGTWAVVGFMALALALTPIIIIANLVIAVIRLVFRGFGHGVGITRVMKNLRASYTFLGFTMLPALVLPYATATTGFLLYVGTFVAALVLMFLLNFIKKYEKGDKKYRRSVRFGGFVRLILLVAFLFIFGTSGVFSIATAGTERTMMLASFACLGIAYIIVGFASRAVTSLGFEFIGYTKGRSLSHTPLIVLGALASLLAFVPTVLVPGHFDANVSLVIAGIVVMLVFLVFTLLGGFVRGIIAKRYNLIDPIINAISEGYPLK